MPIRPMPTTIDQTPTSGAKRLRLLRSTTKTQLAVLILSLVHLATGAVALAQTPEQLSQAQQKNSMRKIRIQPSSQALRIGTAVDWQPDMEAAVAKSRETGKPIFWYVPTINGTFMDRKPEIDRYMLAGPFSWPDVIEDLNQRFIPVRQAPTREQQAKYDLVPYKFIEPGFLIVNTDGAQRLKVDRLTTLHIEWLRRLLSQHGGASADSIEQSSNMKRFSKGEYRELISDLKTKSDAGKANSEDGLIYGMSLFRLGRHAEATKVWQQTSQQFGDDPLGWKAAAEAEKIGPFVRGFEIHRQLPQGAFQFDSIKGSASPENTYPLADVRARGIEFLLGMQDQDGGFRDSDYDFGGTDSLPNVHVAVTALAGTAMLQELGRIAKASAINGETRKKLATAIKSAINFVTDDSKINIVDRDEILWAFAYRLRFLIQVKKLSPAIGENFGIPEATLDQHISKSVAALESVQSRRGNWYHEYNNPFVTATALLALFEAHDTGVTVDSTKIEKGVASLARDRFGNGAFPYASSRGEGNRKPGGEREIAESAGRMPLCELGLWYWGKSSDEVLAGAIKNSFRGQANLDRSLKYDDHTSALNYGGFFFWYDMRARSEAISRVKDAATKAEFVRHQHAIIRRLPEIDGCFVDSHELGRVYGTSMALLSLGWLD